MKTFYSNDISESQYPIGKCDIKLTNCEFNDDNGITIADNESNEMVINFKFSNLYLRHIEFSYKNITKIEYSHNKIEEPISLFVCSKSDTYNSVALDINSFDEINEITFYVFGEKENAELKNIKYHVITTGEKQKIKTIWFRTDRIVYKENNDNDDDDKINEEEINQSHYTSVKLKIEDGQNIKNVWFYVPDDEKDKLKIDTYVSTAEFKQKTGGFEIEFQSDNEVVLNNNVVKLASNNPEFSLNNKVLTLTNAFVSDNILTARNMNIKCASGKKE